MSGNRMQGLSSVPVTVYSLLADDPSDAYFITSDINDCMLHEDHASSLFNAADEVTVNCTVDFGQGNSRIDVSQCSLVSNDQQVDLISHGGPSATGHAGDAVDRNTDVSKNDKVFSMVQATLSANLFQIIGDDCSLTTLHRVCTACNVQVAFNCDTNSYIAVASQTDDICRLERSLVKLLSEIRTSELLSTGDECGLDNACDVTALQSLQSVIPEHFTELQTNYSTAVNGESVFNGSSESVILQLNQENAVEDHSTNVAVAVVQLPLATKSREAKKRGRPRKTLITNEAPFQPPATFCEDYSSSFCTSDLVQADWLIGVKSSEFDMLEKQTNIVETSGSPSASTAAEVQSPKNNLQLENTSAEVRQRTVNGFIEPCFYFCSMCSFRSKRIGQLRRHITSHNHNSDNSPLVEYHFQTDRDNHVTLTTCRERSVTSSSNGQGHVSLNDANVSREKGNQMSVCGERGFACKLPGCSYRASTEYRARRHEAKHRTFDAVVNDSSRTMTSQLVDRFCCKMCDYETVQRDLFRRHVTTVHGNSRPYLCDVCGRRYKRSDALAQHLVVHTAQESRVYHHQCPTCARNFRSLSHLTEHMSTHTSTRSFLCELCGAALKSRSAQRKHIQSIHVEPRAFLCPLCNRRFNTYFALRRHSRLHESDLNTTKMAAVDSKMTSSCTSRRPAIKSTINESRRSQKLNELLSTIVVG